jgi:hypothetical protein
MFNDEARGVFSACALGRFFFILTLRHRGVTEIDAPYLSAVCFAATYSPACVRPRGDRPETLAIISSLPRH